MNRCQTHCRLVQSKGLLGYRSAEGGSQKKIITFCFPPALRPAEGRAAALEKKWENPEACCNFHRLLIATGHPADGNCVFRLLHCQGSQHDLFLAVAYSGLTRTYFIPLEMCNIYSSRHSEREQDGHKQQRLLGKVQ